jgi:hypothetical protein
MKTTSLTPPAFALVMTAALHGSALGADSFHLAPGRALFTMKTNGEWTGFGVRGERPLLEHGGVVIYASRPGSTLLDERASSTHGGMRGLEATDELLFEGTRGGVRYPSLDPDDDADGRIDEDPWDRADNDSDGRIDEDFAAVGDEMAVAVYGTRGEHGITVRQECYAWSLAHIDGVVASTIVVTNAGTHAVTHARVGIELEAGTGLAVSDALTIEGSTTAPRADSAFVRRHVVFDDRGRGLAVLLFVPRAALSAAATSAVGWDIRGDRSRVVVVSPDVGDLAPGASVTVYLALVALPADDLKAARAIRNAHRTVVGDGTSRFIPPVSLMARGGEAGSPGVGGAAAPAEGFADPYWNNAGRLQETLLVGSPNPFRDAISIDYEIPARVIDEDGVEHTLPGSGLPASVKVYNVAGRLVATLVDQPHAPGKYRTGWVARNDDGSAVASGVYYVKLQIGRRSMTMRTVQLK